MQGHALVMLLNRQIHSKRGEPEERAVLLAYDIIFRFCLVR
jgi:hypothetical protein